MVPVAVPVSVSICHSVPHFIRWRYFKRWFHGRFRFRSNWECFVCDVGFHSGYHSLPIFLHFVRVAIEKCARIENKMKFPIKNESKIKILRHRPNENNKNTIPIVKLSHCGKNWNWNWNYYYNYLLAAITFYPL